jgi:3',5'-cyclic AMP phosphodiesterase CpdA
MIIAQISDTHILARDSESPAAERRARDLGRCVADINRQRPDIVIYTGDMVQHGRPEEYHHLREILAPLTAPLYPIPGNRDAGPALRAAFGDHAHLAKTDGFLHYAVEDYPLRLIALDSTADGERKGVFCDRRAAWLDETLCRDPDRPTVLFIHHPPFDIEDHYVGGYRRPREAEDLAAVVSRHPQVVRLLCGHVHCPTHRPWAGTTATTMPSIAVDVRKGVDEAAIMSQPLYYLHRWSEDEGLVTQTRKIA